MKMTVNCYLIDKSEVAWAWGRICLVLPTKSGNSVSGLSHTTPCIDVTRDKGEFFCFRRHHWWGKVGQYIFPPNDITFMYCCIAQGLFMLNCKFWFLAQEALANGVKGRKSSRNHPFWIPIKSQSHIVVEISCAFSSLPFLPRFFKVFQGSGFIFRFRWRSSADTQRPCRPYINKWFIKDSHNVLNSKIIQEVEKWCYDGGHKDRMWRFRTNSQKGEKFAF